MISTSRAKSGGGSTVKSSRFFPRILDSFEDNFYAFLRAREEALLSLIEKAMGKSHLANANQSAESSPESEDTEPVEYDEEVDNDEVEN